MSLGHVIELDTAIVFTDCLTLVLLRPFWARNMVSVLFPPRSLPLNLSNSSVTLQTRKKRHFWESGIFATRTRYQAPTSCSRSVQTFQVISVTILSKETLQFDNGLRALNRFRELSEERLINFLVTKEVNNFTSTSSQVFMDT